MYCVAVKSPVVPSTGVVVVSSTLMELVCIVVYALVDVFDVVVCVEEIVVSDREVIDGKVNFEVDDMMEFAVLVIVDVVVVKKEVDCVVSKDETMDDTVIISVYCLLKIVETALLPIFEVEEDAVVVPAGLVDEAGEAILEVVVVPEVVIVKVVIAICGVEEDVVVILVFKIGSAVVTVEVVVAVTVDEEDE